jgi:hypothetical protein
LGDPISKNPSQKKLLAWLKMKVLSSSPSTAKKTVLSKEERGRGGGERERKKEGGRRKKETSPYPCQPLLFSLFKKLEATLVGVKPNLVPLMTNEVSDPVFVRIGFTWGPLSAEGLKDT